MMKPKAWFKTKLVRLIPIRKKIPFGYENGLRLGGLAQFDMMAKTLQAEWKALKKQEKEALKGLDNPMAMMKAFNKPNPLDYRARKRHKAVTGRPNCVNYATKLKERMAQMAEKDPSFIEEGKAPMSIFAKAEMDVRHDEQMAKLEALRKHGYKWCWLSSHADCSDRCAPWQGKLVDINGLSDLPSHRMGYKKGGYEVYSLRSIMDETDKYGYKNNIIVGFNCRHRLIPYHEGSVPPKKFSHRVMSKERKINAELRAMEREIRATKRQSAMYNEFDGRTASMLSKKAEALTKAYKKYASENGYEWHAYRLEV